MSDMTTDPGWLPAIRVEENFEKNGLFETYF